jgi:carbon starvation protein CstA
MTSRHIDLEGDIDVVAAGSMFLESTLALGALILFTSMSSEARLSAGGTPWEVLLVGLSNQMDEVFNIESVTLFQQSLVVVLLAVCCINSLQLAISLWRSDQHIPKQIPGGNRLGSFLFVSACLSTSWFLTHSSSLLDLWFLFAGINQLLAGLTLMLGTVHLKQAGNEFPQTIVPSVLITLNSIAFLFYLSAWRFLDSLNIGDIFELLVFTQPFSQAVNLVFLITISLLSTAIGLWLTSETSKLA